MDPRAYYVTATEKQTILFGKFTAEHRYFPPVCRNTPPNYVFAKYHYKFVAYLPEHTTLPKPKV
jgi:hypothetical protein